MVVVVLLVVVPGRSDRVVLVVGRRRRAVVVVAELVVAAARPRMTVDRPRRRHRPVQRIHSALLAALLLPSSPPLTDRHSAHDNRTQSYTSHSAFDPV